MRISQEARMIDDTVRILSQSGSFSSHDVINYLATNHNDAYQRIVDTYGGSTKTANSVISNYLRNHQQNLGIQKSFTTSISYNVNGNKSENRDWDREQQ
ncbi:MAG: hypothetical protein MJZ97_00125 [Bacteroidales bacterium]|nr:hypothetical protein [Bacteroidales bacterium]